MKQYFLLFVFLAFTLVCFAQDSGAKRNIYVTAYLDQVEQTVKSGGNAADLSVRESVRYNQVSQAASKITNEEKLFARKQDSGSLPPEKITPVVMPDNPNKGLHIHSPLRNMTSGFSFGPTAKTIQGYSTYRIEFVGDISSLGLGIGVVPGASELRFPISGYFGGGQVGWYGKSNDQVRHDVIRFTLDWYTHASGSRGRMRDSDWFDTPLTPGRSIYSESRVGLGGGGVDGRLAYNALSFGDTVFTGPMLGIKYEKFQFKCSDLEQIGNGLLASKTGTSAGPDIDYTVKSYIPYLGWSADIFFDNQYSLQLAGGYSSLVDVRDTDNHLLIPKIMHAHCQGSAALVDGKFTWDIDPHWQLSTTIQYLYITTSGRQIQTFSDGSQAAVNDQIKSTQLAIDAGLTYRF
jgi:hypothetical protein